MITRDRCWAGLRAFVRTTLESLWGGSMLTLMIAGLLYALSCSLSVLGGARLAYQVAISAGLFAIFGFLVTEIFLVAPLAVVLGFCAGIEALAGRPRTRVARRAPPRAARCRPVAKARCPVCATALAHDVVACERCETPHHRDCWNYEGKCAIYGCS